ncbi:MAG: hypothetical protein ACYCV0_03430 [Desulfitobacteriaceae bacterium]
MWKISPEAMAYLAKQQVQELTVDQPVTVSGCCIQVSEPPRVRMGEPLQTRLRPGVQGGGGSYVVLEVEGIKLNVPSHLAALELTIDLTWFFRREKLVIEGWNLV